MHAIVYGKSGELKLAEIDKPVPADDEVLLKVRTASVNPLDYHFSKHPFLRPMMARLTKVKTLRPGRDVAGQVEATGKNVTHFKIGDEVFGACNGAFAEYACARESAPFLIGDRLAAAGLAEAIVEEVDALRRALFLGHVLEAGH